ncbi:uncharacterized protein DEA37_0013325 [Paragonimus westermani]|uniref:Reverse transcriptase domain-containing protein n=1 Tax=Paragonimus westermani TaxID=34504 RepID=A0A5J4NSR5_9TREM|nr:uncharacterized protein DEA37_0013325 [Paragonimus westermani]
MDVDSLFTYVPLRETVDFLCDFISSQNCDISVPLEYLKDPILLCTENVRFDFVGLAYKQIDGVAMGSPLGPTLANIFLGMIERRVPDYIADSLLYKRYVDDILIFTDAIHFDLFFNFLNNIHPNLSLSHEVESNNSLPFLDVLITRRADGTLYLRHKTGYEHGGSVAGESARRNYSPSANFAFGPENTPPVQTCTSHFPPALSFEELTGSSEDQKRVQPRTHAHDIESCETKISPIQRPHLNPLNLEDASRSEKLRKLTVATANALTEALGISDDDLNSQIVAGFGEAIRASAKKHSNNKLTPKWQQTVKGNKLQVKHAQVNELSSPSSGDSVVYRLRIESVRHCRLKPSDSYKDFYPTGTAQLPNPTPPMGITLRGVNCSSPSLKLISAELARLGEVAGHPVILRDPHTLGQQSGKRQSNMGDITRSVLDKPSMESVSPKRGWPQVDYFAIVCCSFGKILGVDVNPITHGVKHSRYDWFIKTIMIDELGKQKKYLFRCNQWLTVEDRTLRCKRVRINSATVGLENKATHHTFESTLSVEPTSQHGVHINTPPSTSMFEPAKGARRAAVDVTSPKAAVQINANRVEASEDRPVLFTDHTVATQKKTIGPKLLDFSKVVKTHECEKYRTVYENEQRLLSDDSFEEPENELDQKAAMISTTAGQIYYNLECLLQDLFAGLDVRSPDVAQESESVDPIYECLRVQSTAAQSEIIQVDSNELDKYNLLMPSEPLEHKLRFIAPHMFTFLDNLVFMKPPLPNIEPLPIPDLVQTIDMETTPPTFIADVSPEELAHLPRITSFPPVVADSPDNHLEKPTGTADIKPQSVSLDDVVFGGAETTSFAEENKSEILDAADEAQYEDEKWEQDKSELDYTGATTRVNVTSLNYTVDSQDDVDRQQSVIPENVKPLSMSDRGDLQNADIYFDPHSSLIVDGLKTCPKTNTEQIMGNSTVLFPYLNECDMERRLRQIAGLEDIWSSPKLGDVACESSPPTQLFSDINARPMTPFSADNSQVTVICCAPTETIVDMGKSVVDQLNNSQGGNQFIRLYEIPMGCRQTGPYTKLFDWELCYHETEDPESNHLILGSPGRSETLAHSVCAASEVGYDVRQSLALYRSC